MYPDGAVAIPVPPEANVDDKADDNTPDELGRVRDEALVKLNGTETGSDTDEVIWCVVVDADFVSESVSDDTGFDAVVDTSEAGPCGVGCPPELLVAVAADEDDVTEIEDSESMVLDTVEVDAPVDVLPIDETEMNEPDDSDAVPPDTATDVVSVVGTGNMVVDAVGGVGEGQATPHAQAEI
ncbi:hypothetical protein AAE478_008842 [Parahypoxylon ruwenzoriense]